MPKLIKHEHIDPFTDVLMKPIHLGFSVALAYAFTLHSKWHIAGIAIPSLALVAIALAACVIDIIELSALRVFGLMREFHREYGKWIAAMVCVMWITTVPACLTVPLMFGGPPYVSGGMSAILFGVLFLPCLRFLFFSSRSR